MPERSICRIDSTTPHSGHDDRLRRLAMVGAMTAWAGESLTCASSEPFRADPLADDVSPAGVLASETAIERSVTTIPAATNNATEITATHIDARVVCLRRFRTLTF